MNPVRKLMSRRRGSSDTESVAEAHRLAEERDMIRISQNTTTSQLGIPSNMPPTRDVLEPASEDSQSFR
jgi:hypothetical protein